MAPRDTPPAATVAPATVPGPRPDEDTTHRRLIAETFIGVVLDEGRAAAANADESLRSGDKTTAAMWLQVAQSAREDARRAARVIGRLPR